MLANNPFAALRLLLPGQPLLVGVVVSGAGGTYVIELPGGARIQARGTAVVGTQVFVAGGAIQGEAPALTVVTAEV